MAQAYTINSINSLAQENQSAFLMLKVWEEKLEGGRIEWRGEVLDVDSNIVSTFEDWPELVDVITHALDNLPTCANQAQDDLSAHSSHA